MAKSAAAEILRMVRDSGAVDDNHGAEDWSFSDTTITNALKQLHDEVIESVNQIPGLGASHPHFANYISKNDVIKFIDSYFKEGKYE